MSAEAMERLFQKFSQVHDNTGRSFGGTGLGLAISKRLIELMGGTIGVSSRLEKGSTFWVTLPLPISDEPIGDLPGADVTGLRVLLVEPNPVSRRVLDEQIASLRFRNASVASASAALSQLREGLEAADPYRIAIIDEQIPDMDGITLARQIRSDAALRDMALILLGSMSNRSRFEAAAGRGLAGYLAKPVHPSNLLDAIATAWASAIPAASPRSSEPAAPARPLSSGAPTRVLLVEDNLVNQKVGRLILEKLGCRADFAGNGREAVDMFDQIPYDIIFMDCEMPVMDGFAAAAEIRRRYPNRPVPIIAMTARALAGDRERCLAAGMNDYVSKPVQSAVLQEVLGRWRGQTHAPGELAPTSS
jgi:CheY-like chemotaxis protein